MCRCQGGRIVYALKKQLPTAVHIMASRYYTGSRKRKDVQGYTRTIHLSSKSIPTDSSWITCSRNIKKTLVYACTKKVHDTHTRLTDVKPVEVVEPLRAVVAPEQVEGSLVLHDSVVLPHPRGGSVTLHLLPTSRACSSSTSPAAHHPRDREGKMMEGGEGNR